MALSLLFIAFSVLPPLPPFPKRLPRKRREVAAVHPRVERRQRGDLTAAPGQAVGGPAGSTGAAIGPAAVGRMVARLGLPALLQVVNYAMQRRSHFVADGEAKTKSHPGEFTEHD